MHSKNPQVSLTDIRGLSIPLHEAGGGPERSGPFSFCFSASQPFSISASPWMAAPTPTSRNATGEATSCALSATLLWTHLRAGVLARARRHLEEGIFSRLCATLRYAVATERSLRWRRGRADRSRSG